MLNASTETSAPVQRPVPGSTTSQEALRTELDGLNETLRVLKSTDFAVRAYAESWIAFVALSVAIKMVYDWYMHPTKSPVFAIPFGVIGLGVLFHSLGLRLKKSRLAREEETKLRRQRELRSLLGLEEADFSAATTKGTVR